MKKLTLLLNKDSVINFSLLFTLLRRYWIVNSICVLVSVGALVSFYINQDKNYVREIHFNSKLDNVNQESKISQIIGINKIDEIKSYRSLVERWDFKVSIAQDIMAVEDINEFYIEDDNGDKKNLRSVYEYCSYNKECISRYIAENIQNNYSIKQSPRYGGYVLYSRGKNKFTTLIIQDSIVKNLKSIKFNSNYILAKEKIQALENELEKNEKQLLDNHNIINVGADSRISDLDEVIREQEKSLAKNKELLFSVDSDLKFYKKMKKVSFSGKDRSLIRKKAEIEQQIVDVSKNIDLLKSGSLAGNSEIIVSLKKQRSDLANELKKLKVSDASITDDKKNKTIELEKIPELIQKKKTLSILISKLTEQISENKIKRDKLLKDRNLNTITNDQLNPLKSTIVDIRNKIRETRNSLNSIQNYLTFNILNPKIEDQKKFTLKLLILLSIILSVFTALVSCFICYFLDDRVYSHEEIQVFYHDAKDLGIAPEITKVSC